MIYLKLFTVFDILVFSINVSPVEFLDMFCYLSVIDGFDWFHPRNAGVRSGPKAPVLVLWFSYYAFTIFLIIW